MRPLFARALAGARGADGGVRRHALSAQGRLAQGLPQRGGASRRPRASASWRPSSVFRIEVLDRDGTLALEPALAPVFQRAVHWPEAASVTNPLAVTKAYAARFAALGGVVLTGDARSLHRAGDRWRVDTDVGPVDAREAVLALGPWTPDVLGPLGMRLPLAVKRGYHRHFRPRGNAGLTRPVVDAELGYCVAPMEQGLRLTTGAEFAARDAPPTPAQLDRLLPAAQANYSRSARRWRPTPWMGSRPCFADSRPVIGRAPGQPGLWLSYGHAHWGLTLGPATGRLAGGDDDRRDAVLRSGALRAPNGSLADGAHDARGRPAADGRQLIVLEDRLVVGGDRLDRRFRPACARPCSRQPSSVEQLGDAVGGRVLEIMHQHNAFAELLQLRHHRLDAPVRACCILKSNESKSVEKIAILRSPR